MNEFQAGDTVCHFKRELCTADELKAEPKKYLYEIVGVAENTEDGSRLMIYKALYGEKKLYARPLDMFYSAVDAAKYPTVKQKYRFEKVM